MKSSSWAITWLVKLFDITKLGWPVAQPRFSSRPSASTMIEWPPSVAGNTHSSTCGLMLTRWMPSTLRQAGHVDLGVEVPDVADDRVVLHPRHVVDGDHVHVAGGGDEEVGGVDDVLERRDLVALHRRLQRADRVDLGDDHAGALAAQRLRAALADVAVAADHGDLAREHHVGGAADAVDERVATAVEVVELALGDRVVDVDRREQQRSALHHLVEAVHAGGRLLGDAQDALGHPVPATVVVGEHVA